MHDTVLVAAVASGTFPFRRVASQMMAFAAAAIASAAVAAKVPIIDTRKRGVQQLQLCVVGRSGFLNKPSIVTRMQTPATTHQHTHDHLPHSVSAKPFTSILTPCIILRHLCV